MLPLLLLSGCSRPLSAPEAREALAAFVVSSRADSMVTGIVELTTGFTIGDAVEGAAEDLRAFVQSRLPCSTVTRQGDTVTLDFGTLGDACTWNGATWAGTAEVTLTVAADGSEVFLQHAWTGLSNGAATLDGEADVTWDLAAGTRELVHTAIWSDGETVVTGEGARVQSLIDADLGLEGGILVEGSRSWTVDDARWSLDIDRVEARLQDPVPQAGSLTLTTPAGKAATLTFERRDADTIRVRLEGARRPYAVDVTGIAVAPVEE